MFRSIKSVLFSLLLVVAFTSCEKEESEEHGDGNSTGGTQSGTASFTLDGAPLPCATPLISGDYIVGQVLDPSNTVTLGVNVSVVGTYIISTGLINGMQFSGNGTFATTGPQTITLFGAGAPTTAMTSSFEPGIHGCTFFITAITGSVTPVGGLKYSADIDGTPFAVDMDSNPAYHCVSTVATVADDATLYSAITPIVTPRPAGTTELKIERRILHTYASVSNITFRTFLNTATTYTTAPSDGVAISWGDETGVTWSTSNAPATQTGSVFTIVSVADEPGQTDYTVRVTATFNCTLYDATGNAKVLTNGQYVGLFSKL